MFLKYNFSWNKFKFYLIYPQTVICFLFKSRWKCNPINTPNFSPLRDPSYTKTNNTRKEIIFWSKVFGRIFKTLSMSLFFDLFAPSIDWFDNNRKAAPPWAERTLSIRALLHEKEWLWFGDILCLQKEEEFHRKVATMFWSKMRTCNSRERGCALNKIQSFHSDFEKGLWRAFLTELYKHQTDWDWFEEIWWNFILPYRYSLNMHRP